MKYVSEHLEFLESAWEQPEGFLGRVRMGHYDAKDGMVFLERLEKISVPDGENINRRLVSLLWWIPTFLRWQRESIECRGIDMTEYDKFCNRAHGIVENILGFP